MSATVNRRRHEPQGKSNTTTGKRGASSAAASKQLSVPHKSTGGRSAQQSRSRSRSRDRSRTPAKGGSRRASSNTKTRGDSLMTDTEDEDEGNRSDTGSTSRMTPRTRRLAERLASENEDYTDEEDHTEDETEEGDDPFQKMGRRGAASPGKTPRGGSSRDRRSTRGAEVEDAPKSTRSASRSSSKSSTGSRSSASSPGSTYSSTHTTPRTSHTSMHSSYTTPAGRTTISQRSASYSRTSSAPGTGVLSSIASSLSATPLGTFFAPSGMMSQTTTPSTHRPYTRAMELSDENNRLSTRLSNAVDDMRRKVEELLKGHEGACDESCMDRSVRATTHREGYFPSTTTSSTIKNSVSPMRSMGADDRAGLDTLHQTYAFLALFAACFTWTNCGSHVIDIIPIRYANDGWVSRFWKGTRDFIMGYDTHTSAYFKTSGVGTGALTYHFFWLSLLFSSLWLMVKLVRQANLRSRIIRGYWIQALPVLAGCFIAYAIGGLTLGPAFMLAIAGVVSRAWPVTYIHTFTDHALAALGYGAIFILSSWYGFHDVTNIISRTSNPQALLKSSFDTPVLAGLSWELIFFSLIVALIMCADMYRRMPWLDKYLSKDDGSFYSTWTSCWGSLFILTLLTGGVAVPSLYFMISELLMAFPRAPGTTPSYLTRTSMSTSPALSSTKARAVPGSRAYGHDLPSPSHRVH